jgi:hypothetical protein
METILIQGAEIYYDKNFFPVEEATILFNNLLTKCDWQRPIFLQICRAAR